MTNLIDLNPFKNTPVYAIHTTTFKFKKLIEKANISNTSLSSKSSHISSSEKSSISDTPFLKSPHEKQAHISSSEKSSISDTPFLKSPHEKQEVHVAEVIPPVHYKDPPDTFKAYRKFLGKAVPVVRRREFKPMTFQQITDAELESPKLINKRNLHTRSTDYGVVLAKKIKSNVHQKAVSIPMIFFKNLRLENAKKTMSLKNLKQKMIVSNACSVDESLASFYDKNDKNKLPGVLAQKHFVGVNKDYENHFKYLKEKKPQFLPARKRYKFL
ncbi:hypothetical protein SteCoe_21236 [Stentor coeruleus]|uniref:Uncharacterized protein n=1 Tax=Stentor coeruleus TaxID=5963 RepID=A0A1R2BQ44_9CILI|nr:hypothetical protein SteCoe_21236 [Stentor coeruleus]